ncbi:glycosyl hydrolase [Paenibacillus zeisoli]|uniref:Glycosyl hydrolase n=1 Tax=Paenibacillus zeisoli TaxID=2496267 RepID=A0A433XHV8_9BACL|nr:glycosyl hydrolase [Paenibacillus zeisoli]RUT33646.1 glycosyl hydrolase [Paenibacillus zeisoli]
MNAGQRKLRWLIPLLFLVLLAIALALYLIIANKTRESPTLSFVEQYMTNPNGTLATYLVDAKSVNPDIVAGHEALSESVGIWMQIALANKDQTRFDGGLQILKDKFLSPQQYIAWKLQPDGTSQVHTNALGDDLRIEKALLDAYDLWHQPNYLNMAQSLAGTLRGSLLSGGYWVDFHDFNSNLSSHELSLVYIDIPAMKSMKQHGLMDQSLLVRHTELLRQKPVSGVFYPTSFDVSTKTYITRDDANLIDQLIIAIHLTESGDPAGNLITFLKHEWETRGKLFGRYNRQSLEPTVSYESPSVYGLAIVLAMELKDQVWADELYTRMISFRGKQSPYKGGYVANGNSHIFDNLIPLLAESLYFSRKGM